MAPRCCNKICCLTCCTVAFAILALVGGLIFVITNPILFLGLEAELVADSPDSIRYADWACKFSTSTYGDCEVPHFSVPFYEGYTFFNLTNYEDVLNGAKPIYLEQGPYFYQVNITKFNISFSEDGEFVDYIESHMYTWAPELSCAGCDPSDEFIGVNAGYLGAVDTAASEKTLILGLTGPSVDNIIKLIDTYYVAKKIEEEDEETVIAACQAVDSECTKREDIALVQWGYYSRNQRDRKVPGIYGEDVASFDPEHFPNPAELGAFLPTIEEHQPFNLTQMRAVFYDQTYGIVQNPLNLLEMLDMRLTDPEELARRYYLSENDMNQFVEYLLLINSTWTFDLFQSRIQLQEGGGLFSKRSMYQWIFEFSDPLLLLLQPGDPSTAIRHNDTSIEDALTYKGLIRINTGKNNNTDIANVVLWNGTDVVNYWQEPYPVYGNNQDGQFYFQKPNSAGKTPELLADYAIWSPDHARTIYLYDTGIKTKSVHGDIDLHRMALRNDTYDVSEFFHQPYQGFIDASTYHMDPPFRPRKIFGSLTPLYMSQPRFWGCDPSFAAKVEIVGTEPNFDDCATFVDVEPISGNVMFARKRLQVNFLVNETSTIGNRTIHPFNVVYTNIPKDLVMYPVLFIEQRAEVTEELADDWNANIGLVVNFRNIFFIVGLSVGCVGFFLCLFLVIRAKKAQAEYQPIN